MAFGGAGLVWWLTSSINGFVERLFIFIKSGNSSSSSSISLINPKVSFCCSSLSLSFSTDPKSSFLVTTVLESSPFASIFGVEYSRSSVSEYTNSIDSIHHSIRIDFRSLLI